ncbi:metallophosphoesterase [Natronolimnohabitans innermongolicus]|uniref:Metallophosphoesterase n=1 Tax=Natronolimnohabitans innermongolicus JCM 12255 TaxID=1227499 RepID=L9WHP4_9EURY|nr:metallophosphoesterase [Natronolimnohabitans innermongolicus]ELY48766.1 metallophosphoesterase [Natronolimnohabitans innermongolicus JCM 12255]
MSGPGAEPTARVEPVPGEPAAIATLGDERALLVADYHAGYEAGLRSERGVDVPSHAPERRERLLELLERTVPDRLVVLGDLMHSIGDPGSAERGELEVLFEAFPPQLEITVVKGNHDGGIEDWLTPTDDRRAAALEFDPDRVTVTGGAGVALGDREVGVCHGHTWPAPAALDCDIVCLGHEHPCVRLEDEVGGSRVERAWLRGRLNPERFRDRDEYADVTWLEAVEESADDGRVDGAVDSRPRVVVVPAFNDLVGGTWVNVPNQSFLAPFLPDGLADGEAYLLDGTRLGPYESV